MKQPNADELVIGAVRRIQDFASKADDYLTDESMKRIILTETHLSRLIQEREELMWCLRELHDNQNGCPLIRYEQRWNECMTRTEKILGQCEKDL